MNDVVKVAPRPKKGWFTINISLGNDNEDRKTFVGTPIGDFLIERGKDVVVPKEVLQVLDDAVIGVDERDPFDQDKTIVVKRKRFPYTVVLAH